ncbi:putative Type IV pilus assembly protein PilX [Burkholderiales bacterium 8X]|nr:putative Type IV pilus assembly protein PilX [Burkholderiales bacterium 8X]
MTDQPVLRRRSLAALPSPQRQRQRQRGAALFVGLVFTLAALLLAVGAITSAVYQQRIAGSTREREVAFQAAEAALRDAELSIMCRTYQSRSSTLGQCVAGPGSPASPACLPGCGGGPPAQRFAVGFEPFAAATTGKSVCPNGLCTADDTQAKPIWETVDWTATAAPGDASGAATTVPIGFFTGHPGFATGAVVPNLPPAWQPRFLIEAVPAVCDPAVRFCTYRITATGWGSASAATRVTLQELFRPW